MNKILTKKCLSCNKEITKSYYCSVKSWHKRVKYCSRTCAALNPKKIKKQKESIILSFKTGKIEPWNKGIISPYIGENNPTWKGEKAGYSAIHKWVAKWKGSINKCDMCGNESFSHRKYHWANIDHTYRRVLDDYIRLCVYCHVKYDKENKLK